LLSVGDTGTEEGFKNGHDHLTTGNNDYDYDENGNMTQDLNKGITSIEYNYLNLPSKVFKGDEYIKYIYNAAGIKLAQEVYNDNNELQKRTDYIGEFIYEQEGTNPSELAIIQHEEGRIVPNSVTNGWDYQYHLKDHLGNTRLTFTTKPKTHEFTLNYEEDPSNPDDFDSTLPEEEWTFKNMDNIILADLHDHTDTGNLYDKSQKLTGADGAIVGSILTIPVGKGDRINATVSAKYLTATGTLNGAATVAGSLIGALTGNSTTANFEGAANSTTASSDGSFVGALGSGVNTSEPMAFINLMFLSEDATDVTSDRFSYGQISSASSNAHASMSLPEVYEAPSNGYVIVYLSNDSDYLREVYFDDLKVTVNESKVIQTDDYYPFGLQHAGGFNRATAKDNKFLYGGKELQDELDLGWLDYGWRMYQPEIGRWNGMDALSEKFYPLSPYNYAANSPILITDPDGRDISFSFEYEKDKEGNDIKDKNGNRNLTGVTMTVTGKVVNTTNKDIDLDQAASDISKSLEASFKGNVDGVSFKTETNITAAKNMEDVSDSDHIFALAEMKEAGESGRTPLGASSDFGGKVAFIDADYFSGWWDTGYGTQGERTATHELGHLSNLRHKNKDKDNLMKQGVGSTNVTPSQLASIVRSYLSGKLNRGKNYEYITKGRRGTNKKKMPRRGRATSVVDY
jgi:RHS repeat-associated protein